MSKLLDMLKNSKIENRKEILAEAEKYEWHDLRLNPTDLPKEIGDKEYLIKYGSVYYLAMYVGTFYGCDLSKREMYETSKHGKYFVTYDRYISVNEVIAWKEIEPFELRSKKLGINKIKTNF